MITKNLGDIALTKIAGPFGADITNYNYLCSIGLFALDDDSVVHCETFSYNASTQYSLEMRVIDASGAVTWYSTGIQQGDSYFNSILPLGSGLFFVTAANNGHTFFFRVANHKLNNPVPILVPMSAFPLTNPCYNGNPKVFYDGASKRLAVGFYDPAGQEGTLVYASIYDISVVANPTLISTGYVGVAINGIDPFNKSAGLAAGYAMQGIASNGLTLAALPYPPPNGYLAALAAVTNAVKPGLQTDCATASGAQVTTVSNAYLPTSFYKAYSSLSDSNIPNFAGLWQTTAPVGGFFTDGNILYNYTLSNIDPNMYTPAAVALTRKYLFASAGYIVNAAYSKGAIFIADNPQIVSGTNAIGKAAYVTVNSTRPISLSGAYLT